MTQKSIITNPETVQALQELHKVKEGLLRPIDVVEAARSETSPLHKHFEWDDTAAAEKFRIEQARGLLQRVFVRVQTPDGKERMTQVFVSLSTDRFSDGGGYRQLVDVLSDSDMRNQLVRDALADMQMFESRYKEIQELASVYREMKRARKILSKTA